jgi:hypothetical protein
MAPRMAALPGVFGIAKQDRHRPREFPGGPEVRSRGKGREQDRSLSGVNSFSQLLAKRPIINIDGLLRLQAEQAIRLRSLVRACRSVLKENSRQQCRLVGAGRYPALWPSATRGA